MNPDKPALYLFPVPMGDVAPSRVLPAYNIELIRQVRHFIVENVRSARRFLKACDRDIDIDSLTFAELNEHTRRPDFDTMLAPLAVGESMGVISEAGCPAIADPGADAVDAARRRGYKVVPLVGPSSITMSLMASGFNGQSFAFNGYLPISDSERAARLRELERRIRREDQTQIFIEAPYRNAKLLQWMCERLSGDLRLCVASDITGEHERIITRSIAEWKSSGDTIDKIPTIFLLYK